MKTLVLGGVRSGKSRYAEAMARKSGLAVSYIATAKPDDAEMAARIAHHRGRRPVDWVLVEEPLALGAQLNAQAAPDRCVMVDCLTLWLTNLLLAPDGVVARERGALLDALLALPGEIVLVSNETGLGVVPLGELTRRYCDEAGRLHQDLARICDRVVLMVAGLPLFLKGNA
ncbi:MAG: bifunctional adenosylcobinamide kinase/adenosylcobinamide-phosphate guanylyltransferase [Alphaproteobacteria bacterium]|nr:bifunctional adenosylcobinamide kinase/adenosylcobinamide-phosphate guanylyltransferase [Alphaproteobacteria bacterium]MBU6473074.1 bifunctional adenosylcobinamide kinase/adenosylcobinamide-phosphate guanylyltransferase [Alphaproteobacteria bacterium]MDE2012703.1 bifunctional adenosylcobinamide kinase/adenosylcobinamide-phosphate guanylyltransferase [Alphaproteobacteria bacterium]MDE2072027.1 bifunctional adenosylcobinamide kinase/adenosylcobinamide-phosphate guanylyltransferase [Alphaproteob